MFSSSPIHAAHSKRVKRGKKNKNKKPKRFHLIFVLFSFEILFHVVACIWLWYLNPNSMWCKIFICMCFADLIFPVRRMATVHSVKWVRLVRQHAPINTWKNTECIILCILPFDDRPVAIQNLIFAAIWWSEQFIIVKHLFKLSCSLNEYEIGYPNNCSRRNAKLHSNKVKAMQTMRKTRIRCAWEAALWKWAFARRANSFHDGV